MAIKASGSSLAFSEIRAELGPPPSSNIGFYRQSFNNSSRYGNLTLEIADGLPTSGEIKFSDFYSKRLNIVVDHFSSNQTNDVSQISELQKKVSKDKANIKGLGETN